MSGPQRWSRAPLPWRASLEGIVVATADDTTFLAGSAAVVWDALDEPATEADLVAACGRGYGLGPAATSAALAALAEAGLCTPS